VIQGRRVLALIPARAGSKGLPGKNILPADGRPLLAWSIDAAKGSAYVDRVALSSEDDAIMAAARAHGCDVPFRRPAELATDIATSADVALHALEQLPGYDFLVLLQPTSPLRTALDIDACLERCADAGATSCVTVTPAQQSPWWMYQIGDGNRLRRLLDAPERASRRQDLPVAYVLNGAVYVVAVPWFRQTRTFVDDATVACVMPADRSIDIDDRDDFDAFRRRLESSAGSGEPPEPSIRITQEAP